MNFNATFLQQNKSSYQLFAFWEFELLAPEWLEVEFREGPGEADGLAEFGDGLAGGIRSLIMSNLRASSNDSIL